MPDMTHLASSAWSALLSEPLPSVPRLTPDLNIFWVFKFCPSSLFSLENFSHSMSQASFYPSNSS